MTKVLSQHVWCTLETGPNKGERKMVKKVRVYMKPDGGDKKTDLVEKDGSTSAGAGSAANALAVAEAR